VKILFILLFFVMAFSVHAEVGTSSAEYFNQGAATFIRENPEQALAIVNEGLQLHPDDEPLLRLKALLEQQQESQTNQSEQNDQQEQSDQSDQSDKSDPSDEEQDQEQEQDQDQDQDQNEEEQDQQEKQPQPGDLSEEEAEMVLDSLRQLEEAQRDQLMQEMIRRQMRDMPPVEKDW
jgi:Ca-activated chloride channel family protein